MADRCEAQNFGGGRCIREQSHKGGHQWVENGTYIFSDGSMSSDEYGRDLPYQRTIWTAAINRQRARRGSINLLSFDFTYPPELLEAWAEEYDDG